MVMHIVIPPAEAGKDGQDDEAQRPVPWPPEDPDYDVLADPRVSAAIKLWALLHLGTYAMPEIRRAIGVDLRDTIYAAARRLRDRGQRVIHERGLWRLEPSGALEVVNIPHRGWRSSTSPTAASSSSPARPAFAICASASSAC